MNESFYEGYIIKVLFTVRKVLFLGGGFVSFFSFWCGAESVNVIELAVSGVSVKA